MSSRLFIDESYPLQDQFKGLLQNLVESSSFKEHPYYCVEKIGRFFFTGTPNSELTRNALHHVCLQSIAHFCL